MADVTFPAHITVDEEPDVHGLPVLTATVTPDPDAASLSLPVGPAGPAGPRGTPRAPFRKQGEIADEAARPTGLGAEDRGRWWHRLDDDGMDVWTGDGWEHSTAAVGPQGPPAPATTFVPSTTHDAALTIPAVQITGPGPELGITLTAPAGERGEQGPAGDSGTIATATDVDQTTGPTQRSTLALSVAARRWRVQPAPNGFGPWSWHGTDFNSDNQSATDLLTAGTFTFPALPFAWRPMCWGRLAIYAQQAQVNAEVRVRLGSATGVIVAAGAGIRSYSAYYLTTFVPAVGNPGTQSLSPTSTLGSIPAYEESTLVVTVERISQLQDGGEVGFLQANASLTVWAQPITG
ncbi:hypothetical protein IU487_22445 [Nocardia puris]|uniref:hypothetical protein n=1 Tax=Nocardia puris TaxID=208602 RepID=UPI001892E403|nr:hypothetical protein [Nocardia puris]MBF6213781.1 hypothetical protein [Nocardia puris]